MIGPKSLGALTGAVLLLVAATAARGTSPNVALHLSEHVPDVTPNYPRSWEPFEPGCQDFMTAGTIGRPYDLYLVVTGDPGPEGTGFKGLSCGIHYGEGLGVFSWNLCGDASWAGTTWPASGTGIRLTWTACQQGPTRDKQHVQALAGSFYVYAYAEDVFFLTPNQQTYAPEFVIADCGGREIHLPDDARSAARFTESGTEAGYNPCTGMGTLPEVPPPVPPPPPPPPPPPADSTTAALLLHVLPDEGRAMGCGDGPATLEDVVTVTPVPEEDTDYVVYLLGVRGVGGLQAGLAYDRSAVEVTEWQCCTGVEIRSGAWPAPGSGNMVIWSPCPGDELPVAGFFRVRVHEPSVFSLAPHPVSGDIRVGNCNADPFVLLPEQQVGWVSLGEAPLGADSDGCNPALEPCVRGSVPVEPVTWGSLKARY